MGYEVRIGKPNWSSGNNLLLEFSFGFHLLYTRSENQFKLVSPCCHGSLVVDQRSREGFKDEAPVLCLSCAQATVWNISHVEEWIWLEWDNGRAHSRETVLGKTVQLLEAWLSPLLGDWHAILVAKELVVLLDAIHRDAAVVHRWRQKAEDRVTAFRGAGV